MRVQTCLSENPWRGVWWEEAERVEEERGNGWDRAHCCPAHLSWNIQQSLKLCWILLGSVVRFSEPLRSHLSNKGLWGSVGLSLWGSLRGLSLWGVLVSLSWLFSSLCLSFLISSAELHFLSSVGGFSFLSSSTCLVFFGSSNGLPLLGSDLCFSPRGSCAGFGFLLSTSTLGFSGGACFSFLISCRCFAFPRSSRCFSSTRSSACLFLISWPSLCLSFLIVLACFLSWSESCFSLTSCSLWLREKKEKHCFYLYARITTVSVRGGSGLKKMANILTRTWFKSLTSTEEVSAFMQLNSEGHFIASQLLPYICTCKQCCLAEQNNITVLTSIFYNLSHLTWKNSFKHRL